MRSWLILLILSFGTIACAGSPSFVAKVTDKKGTDTDSDPNAPSPEFNFRQLQFSSDSVEYRPVVKVVVIVDNSTSMADEQLYLSQGFQQLMNQLRGKNLNLNLYVYTTTNLGTANQAPVAEEITLYVYTDSNGQQVITTDSSRKDNQLPVTERLQNNLLPPLGSVFEIRADMSSAGYDDISASLQNLIANIGTNGSNSELGLCAIARILNDQTENKIFSNGDFAAFLVISDSNDPMKDDDCLFYKETDLGVVTPNTNPLPALIDTQDRNLAQEWRYTIGFRSATNNRLRIDYDYNSTCNVDGQIQDCVKIHRIYPDPATYGNPPMSTSFVACTNNMVTQLHNENPGRDFIPGTCKYYYYRQSLSYNYTDTTMIQTDLCHEDSAPGAGSYLEQYMRAHHSLNGFNLQSCTGVGKMLPTYGPISSERKRPVRENLSPGSLNLTEAIRTKAVQLFGERNFLFSAIVDQDTNGGIECQDPTEGFGTNYLNFALSLGNRGFKYPICSVDYYPALQAVESFIEEAAATSYQVELGPDEEIIGVTRIRNSQSLELRPNVDYQVQAGTLTFEPNIIQLGDEIQLEIRENL